MLQNHSRWITPFQVILATIILAAFVCLHLRLYGYAEDDAYIHMRVARNLVDHGVPFYNPGEPVMASTAPLWVLAISPYAALHGDLPRAIALLNAFISWLAVLVWCGLGSRLLSAGDRVQAKWEAPLLGLACAGAILPASLALMETPLAILLLGVCAVGVDLKKKWWILPGCLAVFVRPEAIMYLVAISLWRWRKHRRVGVGEIFYALLGLVPVAIFQLRFFGTLVPHTALAKGIVYQISIAEFVRFLAYALYGERIARLIAPGVVCAGMVVLVWLILQPRREQNPAKLIKSKVTTFAAIAAPALCILLAYAVRKVLIFPWYAPLISTPIVIIAAHLVTRHNTALRLLGGIVLTPTVVSLLSFIGGAMDSSYLPTYEPALRVQTYAEIGRELNVQFPHARVLAPEIGALGFMFHGEILDGVGLVTPTALAFHPLSVPGQRSAGFLGAVPGAFIKKENPEVVVSLPTLIEDGLQSGSLNGYRRSEVAISSGRNGVWGNQGVYIFVRRDLPPFTSEKLAVIGQTE